MDMFNYANDLNLYQEWANIITSNRFMSEYNRPYHCAYIGRKNRIQHRIPHQEIRNLYGTNLVLHAKISSVLAPALGDDGYLVRSPDLDQLLGIINDLLS